MQTDLEALRDVEKKARSMISLLDARLIHDAIAEIEELRSFKTSAAISEIQSLRDKLREK